MRMKVTFSDEEQAAIESLRGPVPAATWVRQLVRQAADALAAAETSGSVGGDGGRTAAVSPAGSSPAPASPRPPEVEIARAAAARSEARWPVPVGVRPMVSQPRPIVAKKG